MWMGQQKTSALQKQKQRALDELKFEKTDLLAQLDRLDTDLRTAQGRSRVTASATLSGVRPPASASGSRACDGHSAQSNWWPVPGSRTT